MEIYEGIEIVDLALKYRDTLILGDLQLGYEEHLNKQGVMIPRFQTEDIIKRLDKIIDSCEGLRRIVFNGDVKHEFGSISSQEWDSITRLVDRLIEKYEVIMIKGNHDILLEPVLRKYKDKIKLVDSFSIGDVLIIHGDKIHAAPKKVIIIGHEHPAVSFGERPDEKFKCFLKGEWKGHVLIAMPSFNMLTVGTDITGGGRLSPYLKGLDIDNFDVHVVEDKVYYFGKIKNCD